MRIRPPLGVDGSNLTSQVPAIDRERDARDVGREVGREVERGVRAVLRLDRATQRMQIAEHLAQLTLVDNLDLASEGSRPPAQRHADAARNVSAYLGLIDGEPGPGDRDDLEHILAAAFPDRAAAGRVPY